MPCSDPPTGRPGPPARRSTPWSRSDAHTASACRLPPRCSRRGPTARPAIGSPPRLPRTRRTAWRPSRSSVRGGPPTSGGSSTRPSGRGPSATGSMAGTARHRRRNPSTRSCAPWRRPGDRCSCRSSRFGAASVIGAATDGLGIPVVLLGAHYMHIVDDVAAAVRYPHLHLETSALAHYRAIETVVGSIGAERLLFGTGSPDPGGGIADQRGPRRVDPRRGQARDPRRQRRPPVRRGGWTGRSHDSRRSRPSVRRPHAPGAVRFRRAAGGRRRPARRIACPADGGGGRLGGDRDLR